MRKLVTIEVDVMLEVDEDEAPDAISRTQTDEWRNHFYDLSEDETYEMLAWWFGVMGQRTLDGWADVPRGSIDGYAIERRPVFVSDY